MKPSQHREIYTLAENALYQIDDDARNGTSWNGGVINTG
jgi:hypothetical protein